MLMLVNITSVHIRKTKGNTQIHPGFKELVIGEGGHFGPVVKADSTHAGNPGLIPGDARTK